MKTKKFINSFWFRFVAFFLLFFIFAALVVNSIAVIYMIEFGYFIDNGVNDREDIRVNASYYYARLALSEELGDDGWLYYSSGTRFLHLKNVDYTITDLLSDEILSDTFDPTRNYISSHNVELTGFYYTDDPETEAPCTFYVKIYFPHSSPYQDSYSTRIKLSNFLSSQKYLIAVAEVFFVISGIALFIILVRSAGRSADGTATPGFLGRVPIEVFALIISLLETGCVGLVNGLYNITEMQVTGLVVFVVMTFVLALWLIMSLAARFRSNTFFKYCLTWIILRALGRFFRWIWRIYHKAGLLWRSGLAIFVVSICYLCVSVWLFERVGIAPFMMFLLWFWIAAAFSVACANFAKLKKAIQRLADGDYTTKISTVGMFFDFRRAANNINLAQEGMTKAIEERMKSERLKTELITNVSHDIKTPLTSIVNCVDLMKNSGETYSERTAEYLDILDRQSARLKKLTEDVLEFSKASAGSIAVQLEAVDMGMLIGQAIGEYSDKLEQRDLRPVLNVPAEQIHAIADGKLLWRIYDNLLSNVLKYALPGTRVYIDVYKKNSIVYTVFRNISEYELPAVASELSERFVRGDTSRNTEGSGLGLSISENLCTLMGGSLLLETEADLFKATVTLPAGRPTPPKNS